MGDVYGDKVVVVKANGEFVEAKVSMATTDMGFLTVFIPRTDFKDRRCNYDV